MLSTRVVALCLVLAACSYGVASFRWTSHSTPLPVLMWSDRQIFSSQRSQVLDTITTGDVDFALASVLKTSTSGNSKLSASFNANAEAPEIVVLFVEPELASGQIPSLASAYASTSGGSFTHLKSELEAAGFSLTMPYAIVDQVSLFDGALSNAHDSVPKGSIFVARTEGSDLFLRLRLEKDVKTVEIDSLMTELTSANAFANGMVDLVVVCFDKATTFSYHDEIIGTMTQQVRKATNGNYVAMYSANTPTPSPITWTYDNHDEKRQLARAFYMMDSANGTICPNGTNGTNGTNCTVPTNSTSTINYFPGALIEVYLIVAILLAMVFTGGCAIFSLQTPNRWEVPKTYNKPQDF